MGTAPDHSSGSTSPISSASSARSAGSGARAGVSTEGASSRVGSSSSSLSSESLPSDLVALLLSGGECRKTGAAGFAHPASSCTLAASLEEAGIGAEPTASRFVDDGSELGPDPGTAPGSTGSGALTTSVDMVVTSESLHATGRCSA